MESESMNSVYTDSRDESEEEVDVTIQKVTAKQDGTKESIDKEGSEESQTEDEQEAETDIDLLEKFKRRLEQDDRSVFYDMFELLITKMGTVEAMIQQVKNEQKSLKDRVSEVEKSLAFLDQNQEEMSSDKDKISAMNLKLVEVSIRSENEVASVKQKMHNLAKQMRKGEFILKGVRLDGRKDSQRANRRFYENQATNY